MISNIYNLKIISNIQHGLHGYVGANHKLFHFFSPCIQNHIHRLGLPFYLLHYYIASCVVVIDWPEHVCPNRPASLSESKLVAGERHTSSGLLMLCCALMCVSA